MRVFTLTAQDAQASNVVVTGTLPVCSFDAHVLFDLGSTHSYVSMSFASRFFRDPTMLSQPFWLETPVGESLYVMYEYKSCAVMVNDMEISSNLIMLDMLELDVILGMDWLASCYATLDCRHKVVKLEFPGETSVHFQGERNLSLILVISAMSARKLLWSGCQGYLALVKDTKSKRADLDHIHVVREFTDFFQMNYLGYPRNEIQTLVLN